MQWRKFLTRRWPILAVAILALGSAVVVAQAADNSLFSLANETEDEDAPGWLGVFIQNIDRDLADEEKLPSTDGVYVSGVVEDSPAAEAGLKKGDVILKFNGQEARSVRHLTNLIEETKPGSKIDIEIWRDGSQRVLACEIGREDDSNAWTFDGDWQFDAPDAMDPRAPDIPRAPRAYSFSLGQLSTSYIGVSLYDMSDELAAALGAPDGGVLVNEVEKDSPAEKAGLKAGDVIVEVGHRKVYDTDDVRRAIQRAEDGDKVAVRVLRGKEDLTVDVTVESNDTWSGIGAPFRFHVRPDHAGAIDLREKMRNSIRENMDDWREQMNKEMRELREQLRELREQMRDLR
ncbi:MAG TPA: PDZ domain-containing protein [bacterium]|nr:PDZ domain-containing protein [bacterium]